MNTGRKSASLAHKLNTKLNQTLKEDKAVKEFDEILNRAVSPLTRFDSAAELKSHLCEGALLNIGKIASKALCIPYGEYMVWSSDDGHTMLVPTIAKSQEVFEAASKTFDVHTPSLLAIYNTIERVLSEDAELPPEFVEQQRQSHQEAEPQAAREGEFQSKVDPADIQRHPLWRAMQQQGLGVSDLAGSVGVDPPCISRLLRTSGDSARNPSIGLASDIAAALRTDVEALFPDIFTGERRGAGGEKMGARETTGSHGGGKGGVMGKRMKATSKWTQGNTSQD